MEVVRLPYEELSADYGDIIIESVSTHVEAVITTGGQEVLHEVYYPDINGTVYIRDIGELAMMYDEEQEVLLEEGLDGAAVKLTISLREGSQVFEVDVTIYRCDAETGDSLAAATLVRMPLTRVKKKVTGIGRKEYLSFYETGAIVADVTYLSGQEEIVRTVSIGSLSSDSNRFHRFDLSPSVIAGKLSVPEPALISYLVYKSENETVRFVMDRRAFLNKTTFVFRNTFGAQETFTCTGDHTSDRSWDRTYGTIGRSREVVSRDLNHIFTVNTGYISRETAGVVEDLLHSRSIYLLEDGALRKVTIEGESFKVSSRRDELISVQFDYRYTSTNRAQFRSGKRRIFDFTFDQTFN